MSVQRRRDNVPIQPPPPTPTLPELRDQAQVSVQHMDAALTLARRHTAYRGILIIVAHSEFNAADTASHVAASRYGQQDKHVEVIEQIVAEAGDRLELSRKELGVY